MRSRTSRATTEGSARDHRGPSRGQDTESEGGVTASLRPLQVAFADALFSPAPPTSLAGLDIAGPHPRERFAFYRRSLIERSTAALREAYPVLHRLVGTGFFGHLASEYVYTRPSSSYDLDEMGRHLAGFLADLPEAAGHPYLPDVARLEWAVHQALRAWDATPLQVEPLARLPAESYDELRLTLHPAARLVASPFPILRIWQVNQTDREVERVDLASGACRVLVHRADGDVRLRNLGRGEFAWLDALSAGETLSAAAARATEDEPGFDLGACLAVHLLASTFSGVAASTATAARRPSRHGRGEIAAADHGA